MAGENCSQGCKTRDHETFGACVRAKGLKTNALPADLVPVQRSADRNLDRYQAARKEGIQPKSTRPADIERAVRISDQTGQAFQA